MVQASSLSDLTHRRNIFKIAAAILTRCLGSSMINFRQIDRETGFFDAAVGG